MIPSRLCIKQWALLYNQISLEIKSPFLHLEKSLISFLLAYTSENVVEGKKAAKDALEQRLGLRRSDHSLAGIITRLTVQKGIHLIKHMIFGELLSTMGRYKPSVLHGRGSC